jgi:hypothetical protein
MELFLKLRGQVGTVYPREITAATSVKISGRTLSACAQLVEDAIRLGGQEVRVFIKHGNLLPC